jgi:hypothetical protein
MAWGAPVNSPCTLEGLRQPSGRTSGGPPEVDHQRWCGFTGFPVLPVFQVFGFTGFPSFPGFRVFQVRLAVRCHTEPRPGLSLSITLLPLLGYRLEPFGADWEEQCIGRGAWDMGSTVFFSTFSCSISPGVRGFGWLLHPAPHLAGLAVGIFVHLLSFLGFVKYT